MRWFVFPVLILMGMGTAGIAHANPADIFGYGARGQSMAGAQVASSQDGDANYYNPARILLTDSPTFSFGYQLASPLLRIQGQDTNVDIHRGVQMSLVAPGYLGNTKVAIGASALIPDQYLSRTRTLSQQQPRFNVYNNRPQRMVVILNLGFQPTEKLSIAGGISYISSTFGSVVLSGQVGLSASDPSNLDLAIDFDLKTGRYGQIGAFYEALPWLDIGATYRTGFTIQLDQVFRIESDIGPANAPIVEDAFFELQSLGKDHFLPAQLILGANARINDNVAVSFELGYHRWSAFRNPASEIAIDLDLGSFNDLVLIPDAPALAAPNFSDTIVPRIGVEWTARRNSSYQIDLRGGYFYEPTPVPEQYGDTNFLDSDRHSFHLGIGWTIAQLGKTLALPVSIDASFGVTQLANRTINKLSPVDPIGSYTIDGRIIQASLSTRWRF